MRARNPPSSESGCWLAGSLPPCAGDRQRLPAGAADIAPNLPSPREESALAGRLRAAGRAIRPPGTRRRVDRAPWLPSSPCCRFRNERAARRIAAVVNGDDVRCRECAAYQDAVRYGRLRHPIAECVGKGGVESSVANNFPSPFQIRQIDQRIEHLHQAFIGHDAANRDDGRPSPQPVDLERDFDTLERAPAEWRRPHLRTRQRSVRSRRSGWS